MYDLILVSEPRCQVRRGQLQLLLAVRVAFYPGERKSLWEDYGFITLWGQLYSFGDLDNLVRRLWFSFLGDYNSLSLGAIISLCSWGRLFPFILGDKVSLFLGAIMIFLWGLCGDYVLLPFIPQFVPTKLNMGEGDPTSSVCFFLQLSQGTVSWAQGVGGR